MLDKETRLKECQIRARDEMVTNGLYHLNNESIDNAIICFSAPTGAGKTITVAKTIKHIYEGYQNSCFIWITPGKGDLANQAKESLKKYLINSGLTILSLSEALITHANCLRGTIVVVAWEQINRQDKDGNYTNISMREGDNINFYQMLENTRKLNTRVININDESHHTANSEKSKEISETINPNLTIKVSATPINEGNYNPRITYSECIKAKLIKKNIKTQEFISIDQAIEIGGKRLLKLIENAKQLDNPYLPKLLIFAPNIGVNGHDEEIDIIRKCIETHFGWTEKSGEVVFWLSDKKSENYLKCKDNNSNVKIIITKEALDMGVDIPSINVIIQLRSTKSMRLQIQKIGRGLRAVNQMHYNNDLDTLYFYSYSGFKENIDWGGAEFYKEIICGSTIKIREKYDSYRNVLNLKCAYVDRIKSFINLNEDEFSDRFYDPFEENLKNHLSLFSNNIEYIVKQDSDVMKLDQKRFDPISSEHNKLDGEDITNEYKRIFKEKLKHLYKHESCIFDTIGKSIAFIKDMNIKHKQTFILNNIDLLLRLVNETIEKCEKSNLSKEKISFDYSLPLELQFNQPSDDLYKDGKFLYDNHYTDRKSKQSELEKSFEKMINESDHVNFWVRNYDRKHGESLSIIYNTNNEDHNFFPDYIIFLKDGRIIIVDPKEHDPAELEKKKALLNFIEKTGDIRLFAGIIKLKNNNFYFYGNDEIAFDDFLNQSSPANIKKALDKIKVIKNNNINLIGSI